MSLKDGARAAHKWIKGATEWEPTIFDGENHPTFQSAAEDRAEKWKNIGMPLILRKCPLTRLTGTL